MKIAYLPFQNSQSVINFEKNQNTCLLRYLFSEDGREIIVCGKTLKDCVNLKTKLFCSSMDSLMQDPLDIFSIN